MPEAADILARLDAIAALVAELRAAVAERPDVRTFQAPAADDLAAEHLLDTHAAAARFGFPQDSIRKWCREESLGVRSGGRWLVDPRKLRARINGG